MSLLEAAAAADKELTDLRAEVVRANAEIARLERRYEDKVEELAAVTDERDELEREKHAEPKPFRPDVKRIDAGDWTRASSLCVCDVCGYQYWEHATVQGFEWVHRICDGKLVKL